MVHSQEKSQFLRCEKDVWDRLAEETRRSEGLAAQLTAARQEVAELAPVAREVADLCVREKDAHNNAREAEEKLTDLIERVHMDVVEAERLWKEQDDLLRAIEELHTGIDLAH